MHYFLKDILKLKFYEVVVKLLFIIKIKCFNIQHLLDTNKQQHTTATTTSTLHSMALLTYRTQCFWWVQAKQQQQKDEDVTLAPGLRGKAERVCGEFTKVMEGDTCDGEKLMGLMPAPTEVRCALALLELSEPTLGILPGLIGAACAVKPNKDTISVNTEKHMTTQWIHSLLLSLIMNMFSTVTLLNSPSSQEIKIKKKINNLNNWLIIPSISRDYMWNDAKS